MMKVMSLGRCAFVAFWFLACSSGSSGGGGGGSTGAGTGSGGTGTGGGGIDDCVRACERRQALHCPNDTAGDCSQGCQVQSAVTLCKTELEALTSCSANAPLACGSTGKATTQGCTSEGLAYFSCILGAFDAGLTD